MATWVDVNGVTVFNRDDAMEAMESLGIDRFDVETLVGFLAEPVEECKGTNCIVRIEAESYADHVKSCVDEVLSLVEQTQMGKMTKQTEELCRKIENLINEYV